MMILRGSKRTRNDHVFRLLATKIDVVWDKWVCSNLLYHGVAALGNPYRVAISERWLDISWERGHLGEANQAVC